MRLRLMLAAAVSLAACSQPAPAPKSETPPPAPPPIEAACNSVAPNLSKPVRVQTAVAAAAALAPELRGGPINPGTYDLSSGAATDGAPDWGEDHFVALAVAETDAGVTFNWADSTPGQETQRWSAAFREGPPAQLEFSCGRDGQIDVEFAAQTGDLRLVMPDPRGTGRVLLVFTRRG